jgi:hypothetical protein
MIEQLAQELAGLSVSRIRQVVAKYNRHLKISGHSGLSKEALIGHILQKTNLDRPLMSKLIKETTFHKASSRSRKEPQIDLYSYIGERLKKKGFPKPPPSKKIPLPAPDTEPPSSPEPPRPRPEPTPVVAEDAVISVAPRATSTIEQSTGLTREQFNALDPAEAFGRFLPLLAKRNLLGLNVASEDPETKRLVSKKSSLFTPVGIGIDFSKLFKFSNSKKNGIKLAETILRPSKEQIKNLEVSKFGNLSVFNFGGGKELYINMKGLAVNVKRMTEGLKHYVKTGQLNEYDDFYIDEDYHSLSAMAGYGFNLDIDKAIAEIHRLFPESRGAETRYTGGDYNLTDTTPKSGLHRIGIRDGDFTYVMDARPFGFPTLIKKHKDVEVGNSKIEKKKITSQNMWKDMRKPYTYDY